MNKRRNGETSEDVGGNSCHVIEKNDKIIKG